jgi:galactosyl transferase GMA12/MNN10 family
MQNNATPMQALVTIVSGVDPAWISEMRYNRLLYARRHGYAYCELPTLDLVRKPAWSKLLAIQLLFTAGFSQLVWLDQDAVILQPDLSLAQLFARAVPDAEVLRGAHILAQQDVRSLSLNSGCMRVRVGAFARSVLTEAFALPDEPGGRYARLARHGNADQEGLRVWLQRHSVKVGSNRSRFHVWPIHRLNLLSLSYERGSTRSDGPRTLRAGELLPPLLHFAGVESQRRVRALTEHALIVRRRALESHSASDAAARNITALTHFAAVHLSSLHTESSGFGAAEIQLNPLLGFTAVAQRHRFTTVGPCAGYPHSRQVGLRCVCVVGLVRGLGE